MALAQIQAELSGATDATLRRVARVPVSLLTAPAEARDTLSEAPAALAEVRSPRASFWRTPPAPPAPGEHRVPAAAHGPSMVVSESAREPEPGVESRHLVRLGPGAVLMLSTAPSAADVADLRAAAAPLLRLLADRALLAAEEPRDDDH
jgi:hypothetical protein